MSQSYCPHILYKSLDLNISKDDGFVKVNLIDETVIGVYNKVTYEGQV